MANLNIPFNNPEFGLVDLTSDEYSSLSDEDDDSGIGEDNRSSTMTIPKGHFNSIEIDGRTYLDDKYPLPNDKMEQQRQDDLHGLWLLTLNGELLQGPIPRSVQNVLDVGTGTGKWAIDFADEHSETLVTGTDKSPMQPTYVPPNILFQVDDSLLPWNFSSKFDVIHMRMPSVWFNETLIRQAYDYLNPGGLCEIQDAVFPPTSSMQVGGQLGRLIKIVEEGACILGMDFGSAEHYAKCMEEVGFQDVAFREYQWPIGFWHEDRDKKVLADIYTKLFWDEISPLARKLGADCKFNPEDVNSILKGAEQEAWEKKTCAVTKVLVVYGTKPNKRQE